VVVGEAADGAETQRAAARLQPDVVVMDVHMPKMNGVEATQQIKQSRPRTRVLILSAYEDDHYVFPLLEAGADGYLLKTTSGDDLVRAVRAVARGETVLDPQIAGKVVRHLKTSARPTYQAGEMVEALTERELQVLRQVAKGQTNKEVAEALCISPYTVQVHLRNIFGKLNVSSRTEAVTFALREGWIKLDSP
jgi:DNA-binding NarL/FixJ family response regulator